MGVTVTGRAKRMLPSGPLLAIVERRWWQQKATGGGRTFPQFAHDCGLGDRQVRLWRQAHESGEELPVEAWTADRVLCRLGLNWFDVFDEDVFPEAHEAAKALFG